MFKDKLEQALTFLESKGVNKYSANPLHLRPLWKLGIRVTPPLLSTFRYNLIVHTIYMCLFWMLMMSLFGFVGEQSLSGLVIQSIIIGPILGYYYATRFRKIQSEYQLPHWSELEQTES